MARMPTDNPMDATLAFVRDLLTGRATGLPDPAGWSAALPVARLHGVLPALYVRSRAWVGAPPAAVDAMRQAYVQTMARNTVVFRDLAGLLGAWRDANVPFILLKGCALTRTVYGDDALRPMTDVDVLVRHEHVQAALDRARAAGYAPVRVETRAGDALAFENEIAIRKTRGVDLVVELHWNLLNSPHHQHRMGMDWFWSTAEPLDFDGVPALVLGPEALLLHLCAHLVLHHHAEGLLWWHDIARAVETHGRRIDWAMLLDRAREYDLVLPVRTVIEALNADWGVALPDGALARVRAARPTATEADVHGRLTDRGRPAAQRLADDLRALPGVRRRLAFAWANVFPSADYMRARYGLRHAWQLPLSYPYRWMIGIAGALGRQRANPSP